MRVTSITVSGLFDRFNHVLQFDPHERITIMIGPNGFGKTMILRIINMIFSQPVRRLAQMPFRRVDVSLDDGSSLSAVRRGNDNKANGKASDLELIYRDQSGSENSVRPHPRIRPNELDFPVGVIEDIIPELDQVGPALWRHRGTGESLSLNDVLDKYEDELPPIADRPNAGTPGWLKKIRKAIPVRFISAERLTHPRRYREQMSRLHRVLMETAPERTVTRDSKELAERVQKTLTEYGSLAQSLDRTFPGRLVAEPPPSDLTMDSLRKDLAEVDAKRVQLVETGLLKLDREAFGWSVPEVDLDRVDESKRGVLAVYARDAKKKLSVFDELYTRVDALKRIANSRFLHKQVTVGESGLEIVASDGRKLKLEMLSSGEQHELVLLFDLLFRVPDNSFILIDEPELSFHVAWQTTFLSDLEEVAKISRFRALLATHSPQIIGDRWDLTVELKGPNGE